MHGCWAAADSGGGAQRSRAARCHCWQMCADVLEIAHEQAEAALMGCCWRAVAWVVKQAAQLWPVCTPADPKALLLMTTISQVLVPDPKALLLMTTISQVLVPRLCPEVTDCLFVAETHLSHITPRRVFLLLRDLVLMLNIAPNAHEHSNCA